LAPGASCGARQLSQTRKIISQPLNLQSRALLENRQRAQPRFDPIELNITTGHASAIARNIPRAIASDHAGGTR